MGKNNFIQLYGTINSDVKEETIFDKTQYKFDLEVARLSGNADIIPVVIDKELVLRKFAELDKQLNATVEDVLKIGKKIGLFGEFRSYNKIIDAKSKLMLNAYAQDIVKYDDEAEYMIKNNQIANNLIEIDAYICKQPIYRTTPFNKEITDLIVAVNRDDGSDKSDYLPALCWGRNARWAQNFVVGQKLKITGRIQSRIYQKRQADGSIEDRTAYEVSINKMEL